LLLCGWFVVLTMYQYKKLTGYWQYSPFSGWQFANNAMYAFREVDTADYKPVPKKFYALDTMIRKFYARTRQMMNPNEKKQTSTFYMWSPGMPLMQYRNIVFKQDTATASELKRWASMAPLYKEYGLFIIRRYPWHFAAYFVWPNSHKYFAPPVEFLEHYNSGVNYVTNQTKSWFGYKSTTVKVNMSNDETWVLNFYPILSGIINVVMLIGLLYYVILKGWKYNRVFNKTLLIAGALWLLNAGFTIFASSAALRFQSFPVLLTTTITLLLVDWMVQLMKTIRLAENEQKAIKEDFSPKAMA